MTSLHGVPEFARSLALKPLERDGSFFQIHVNSHRHRPRMIATLTALVVLLFIGGLQAQEAQFYRAINLNGSAVTIDGRAWEAKQHAGSVFALGDNTHVEPQAERV